MVLRMCSGCAPHVCSGPCARASHVQWHPLHAHKHARARTVRTLPDSPTSCDVTRNHRHKTSCRSCTRPTVHGCSSSFRPRSRSSCSTASGPGCSFHARSSAQSRCVARSGSVSPSAAPAAGSGASACGCTVARTATIAAASGSVAAGARCCIRRFCFFAATFSESNESRARRLAPRFTSSRFFLRSSDSFSAPSLKL
jgi:hypothetical protein